MSDRSGALADILTRIEKPGRYVGGEWNEVRKRPAPGRIKVALAFPDVYEIGMSYLGQKILYGLLNADRGVMAERVFAPWPDFEDELGRSGRRLASLESGLPLEAFDIVGFSLLYELNASNILTILDSGGIPLLASERSDAHPLVIAGGPAAFNPEPLADIVDLFLLGDGEEGFPEIIDAVRGLKARRAGRAEMLRELSRMEGVYVPSLYAPRLHPGSGLVVPEPLAGAPSVVRKRVLKDFSRSYFPEKIVVPSLRVVFDRVAVEAARGCPQSCRFCQASSLYFPHRPKDAGLMLKTLLRSLRQTGYEDSSLTSLSIGDYPHLEETVRCLMGELAPEKISLSLSSLRPRTLSRDLVESILKVRKTGFTLVPEAGTERLRAVINKKLRDEEIRDGLTYAFEGGWRLVKLYFMAGLPTEAPEDLEGIVEVVRRTIEIGRGILGAPPRVHVSLSSFIPKPHTPFQWLAMEGLDSLAEKQRTVRAELRRFKSVEFKDHPLETSRLEAVFSRGDRRLGGVLVRAWTKGARFDSWGGRLRPDLWDEAFTEQGVDPSVYLGAIDRNETLPWEHISTGPAKAHLLRELDLALRGESSPTCLERACGECGGCDIRAWKKPAPPVRLSGLPSPAAPPLGEAVDGIVRYRAVYAKKGKARYLSHIDLIHVLQRSFRRAGVQVRKTEGFHPKMDLSYGPALPLGMEGLAEVLEFRSGRIVEEAAFLAAVNRAAPAGIRFLSLEKLGPGAPSLSKAITGLTYTLDWKSGAFREAWELAEAAGEGRGGRPGPRTIGRCLEAYRARTPEAASTLELRGRRLIIRLPPLPPKGQRPQDIVREAFGFANPVFLLCREAVETAPASPSN